MKQIQTHGPSKLKTLGFLAAGLVLGLSSIGAWAAGTASGTAVNNLAKLSYSVGGVAQNEICSSNTGNSTGNGGTTGTTCTSGTNGAVNTAFTVDNKVNLTVIEKDATFTSVVPGQTGAVVAFTVTNNGNTVQDYSLASANSASGTTVFTVADNFDATACSTFVESGATAGYQAAQDTATFIDELAADASKDVYVVCNIPSTQVNGDQAVIQLTATTATGGTAAAQGAAVVQTAGANTAGVDIVFADPATAASVDGTIPLQTARDAIGFARDAYRLVAPVLSVSKTVTPICDPFNANTNPKNIPGAAVQYAITIANTGSAAATLTTVTDTLVAQLAFDPKLNSGAAPAANCVSGNVANTLSASGFGAVTGAGTGPGVTAPGLAAHATTAGATIAGQAITINYSTLATSAITAPAAATLANGNYITVYFNAFVQ